MRILTAVALAGSLALGGCSSFDPIDMFQDWDLLGAGKKPLQGDRRAVFPEGVPGVPQGVPPEMMKGYQAPAEAPPPVIEAPRQKAQKAKKTAAAPRRAPPQQAAQEAPEPEAPPLQQAPAARTQPGTVRTMPGAQPTWPSNAQPAPTR